MTFTSTVLCCSGYVLARAPGRYGKHSIRLYISFSELQFRAQKKLFSNVAEKPCRSVKGE